MTETPILDERAVSEIEVRANAASPGPWLCGGKYWGARTVTCTDGKQFVADFGEHIMSARDAGFVSHAREDIPALCATVKHLRSENEALRKELANSHKYQGQCVEKVKAHGFYHHPNCTCVTLVHGACSCGASARFNKLLSDLGEVDA